MILEADVLLGERYRLVSRIAGGGMGEVWQATDEVLHRDVAVKILRREYAEDATFRERFRAEARHAAALSHAGIAAVYDYSNGAANEDGVAQSPFLVMELVPGEPLSVTIARDGALDPERVLDIIGQAALALQAAHDGGVIHRDVKPGNILLTPDGGVKITDFGISRATNSVPLTATGAIMGTAFYISPEQASGQTVTPASDIYSLGVVAYECLSGRRPFPGDTPVSVALAQVRDEPPALGNEVAPEVGGLVMQMLAKDPAERPSDAGTLGREALAMRAAVVSLAATRAMTAAESPDATQVIERNGDPPAGREGPVAAVVGRLGNNTDPGFRLPAPGRTPHWVPYAVALAVGGVLLVLLVRACTSEATTTTTGTGGSTGNTGGTAASSSPPDQVLVRTDDYVGQPETQARAALRKLGLDVAVRRVDAGPGIAVGTVTGVTPTGRLHPGEIVTLVVAQAPAGHSKQSKHDKPAEGPKHHDRKQGKR